MKSMSHRFAPSLIALIFLTAVMNFMLPGEVPGGTGSDDPVAIGDDPVTSEDASVSVGSKKFTENVILGEILTQLAASAGVQARHRRELGGTRVLWSALVGGDIDVYPDYTGTIQREILKQYDLETERESLKRDILAERIRTSRLEFDQEFRTRYKFVMNVDMIVSTVNEAEATYRAASIDSTMAGRPIADARGALVEALARQRPEDRFTVIRFNDGFTHFSDELIAGELAGVEAATRWVEALSSGGGTAIAPALAEAYRILR